MKFTHKITAIVTAQIILIIASFLIIVHSESQINLAGNAVNIAGKNRAMTSMVQAELNRMMLFDGDPGLTHDGGDARLIAALENLENNILFLKDGGTISGIEIAPLHPQFGADWDKIWNKFSQYRDMVLNISSRQDQIALNEAGIADVERTGNELVNLSDILTRKLGEDIDKLSSDLVLLQTVLGTINVATHIAMISLVWRMFNRYAEGRIKEERFAAVGKFASMVAHDMRNPLGTIANSVELIKSQYGGSSAADAAIDMISRSVGRMSHQIDGVLNHVRSAPLILEDRSIREMLKGSLGAMAAIPQDISVSLPKSDAVIQCDPAKIEFVFANLLLNAVQAIGGEASREKSGSITVRLAEDDGAVTLEFENSGPPIPEENLRRVFEPMFTTKMQGTGLGLASCRSVVEQHGGSITASSDPVTFAVRLPKTQEQNR